ncbi:MAG: hypothetical protein PWQ91_984 [Eubacteriales bacterium]|nr:hypothetical protein [Eubacteriales bacterium]
MAGSKHGGLPYERWWQTLKGWYRSGLKARWRHFSHFLEPLFSALQVVEEDLEKKDKGEDLIQRVRESYLDLIAVYSCFEEVVEAPMVDQVIYLMAAAENRFRYCLQQARCAACRATEMDFVFYRRLSPRFYSNFRFFN